MRHLCGQKTQAKCSQRSLDKLVMTIPFIEGQEDLEITVKCGIKFSVPNDISLITPYVLLEQEDWFEQEAPFFRSLLREGMNVLDIGTNYGLYGLCAANLVGPRGRVYCVEPSTLCNKYLNKTIEANDLGNVEIIVKGLSNFVGETSFRIEENTELNQFVESSSEDGNIETIEVTTLDACDEKFNWPEIDLVKMDAEGQEKNILEGGKKFFSKHSPLVMYELKHADQVNIDLIEAFEAIDYTNYKLIPGAGLLVPFDKTEDVDAYQLNLFACNETRAQKLKEEGILVESVDVNEKELSQTEGWQDYLSVFPYAKLLKPHWGKYIESREAGIEWESLRDALNAFTAYKRSQGSPELAIADLFRALKILLQLANQKPGFSVLISLSRVALEAGERELAIQALSNLYEALTGGASMAVFQPFLAPLARYDDIDPKDQLEGWIMSSIVEAREKYSSYSSYYTAGSTYQDLQKLTATGFADSEIMRRRALLEMLSEKYEKKDIVETMIQAGMKSENAELWNSVIS